MPHLPSTPQKPLFTLKHFQNLHCPACPPRPAPLNNYQTLYENTLPYLPCLPSVGLCKLHHLRPIYYQTLPPTHPRSLPHPTQTHPQSPTTERQRPPCRAALGTQGVPIPTRPRWAIADPFSPHTRAHSPSTLSRRSPLRIWVYTISAFIFICAFLSFSLSFLLVIAFSSFYFAQFSQTSIASRRPRAAQTSIASQPPAAARARARVYARPRHSITAKSAFHVDNLLIKC